MHIIQKPDNYSLTGSLKPIIIDSDQSIMFVLKKGNTIILEETYSPDANNRIYIRGLGKVIENYLTGIFDTDWESDPYVCQEQIDSDFTFQCGTLPAFNIQILRCSAASNKATYLFWESRFLNMQHREKCTHSTASEFITLFWDRGDVLIDAEFYCLQNGVLKTILKQFMYPVYYEGFFTLDVSPSFLLNQVQLEGCIAYTLSVLKQSGITYHLLPPNQDTYFFRYRNSFDVPETFTSNGRLVRAVTSESENVQIDDTEVRTNIVHTETCEFTFCLPHFRSDIALISELVTSSEVEFFHSGYWKKIIIIEEKIEDYAEPGEMKESVIKFRFADKNKKRLLL